MSYLKEYIENYAPESLKTLYYRLESLISIIATLEGRLTFLKATRGIPSEIQAITEEIIRYKTEYTNVHKSIVKIKTKKNIYCGWEKEHRA
jgi:hypothetical protein